MRIIITLLLLLPLSLTYANGMVVTEHQLASNVGRDILAKGGNAFDAAVAVGYALAVVNPCCGNIGGGGFLVAHLKNGKNIFINFREKAPINAAENLYSHQPNNASEYGYLAVATPGTVKGFDYILKKYGTFSREKVMQGAIQLAEKGFKITPYLAHQFTYLAPIFSDQLNVAQIFEHKKIGDLLIQKNLATTLKNIATLGPSFFYEGPIAKTIVAESHQHHGILSLEDFSQYNVEEMPPISCTYRGLTIISAPPPSSGGVTLCEMLNILENLPLRRFGPHAAETKRFIIETMRYGFLDRNTHLADPDYVKNPIQHLLDKEYARTLRDKILTSTIPIPPPQDIPHPELTDTTHYSIIDDEGNAVSVTYTLNGFFGAKVIAGETGFFLNNEMDDFTTRPGVPNKFGLVQSNMNAIQPKKRPLSSMTPTIVMKDNRVLLVIGSPGGPRIISALLLAILNIVDFNMPLKAAINAPRFHFQGLPNAIDMEPFAFSSSNQARLISWDYHLMPESTWGAIEAIYIDPLTHQTIGVNDYRRPDGSAE